MPNLASIEQLLTTARQYTQAGQFQMAAAVYRQMVTQQPRSAEAWRNLGDALAAFGRLDEAIVVYQQSLQLQASSPETLNHLGIAFQLSGRLEEAINVYRQAMAMRPDAVEAMGNLSNALRELGRIDDALEAAEGAVSLKPSFERGYIYLGNALRDKNRTEEAIQAYRKALNLDPNLVDASTNLGVVLHERGEIGEAIAVHRKTLISYPDHARAHYNLAQALLLQGEFEQGWKEYEWRFTADKERHQSFPQSKYWDGIEDLSGKRILLHAEQGFGDQIQFVRFVRDVTQRGANVILQSLPPLVRLMRELEGIDKVESILSRGETVPDFDLHCPLMSLPLRLGIRLETIASRSHPYVRSDPVDAAKWKNRMSAVRGHIKVGLAWAGRLTPDPMRSIPISALAPLAEMASVAFLSLQKDVPGLVGSPESQDSSIPLIDWTTELLDFADTAALVQSLDLVISIDTAVAHLAGALGKPVWVLLPFAPDWRWLRNRSDSPWYPTMRLFRQPKIGDWESPVNDVAAALKQLRIDHDDPHDA